jgi:hypothetical protein
VDGYVQQFDKRGQPKNPAARDAAKEFRHAKNEVMEAMGVVKRKGIQEIWRRKSADRERLAALLRGNSCGPWLKALDHGLTLLSLCWLMSLQRRFQVREKAAYPKRCSRESPDIQILLNFTTPRDNQIGDTAPRTCNILLQRTSGKVCHNPGHRLPPKSSRYYCRENHTEVHKWKRQHIRSPTLCYSHVCFASNVGFLYSIIFCSR